MWAPTGAIVDFCDLSLSDEGIFEIFKIFSIEVALWILDSKHQTSPVYYYFYITLEN
jgi:hypothetical protein